ncbi:uncharacterized protein BHQ10_000243 [Talaromyces amestolkiae]|uniref:Uncharacterized protein n=1 Tax=Talaromyces amestolkiae TaxID=1196081 RepID=A0A364KL26_TALAM|nr:uncharacterized protein BHQ10_000243 [Talaromyces amestolkiae]RAO64231.1 hypothetical protein BHQ10_000243 [Talaromyces amestolkiae]
MAAKDEITSQAETVTQSHDSEKLSETKASEKIASVASQGAVPSTPQLEVQPITVLQPPLQQQQQQHSQTLSSTQINASISGNASPQLFQVQQQPGQAPQTMALINGQLVPVSTVHVQVPVSGSGSNSVVLPQVQVQVQGPAAVNMQASIVQKQSATEGSTSTSTQQKPTVPESKQEKTGLTSNVPATSTQPQTNNNASPASRKTRDPGCGCGFWAAILRSFQQKGDNKNDTKENQTTTADSNTQNDKTTSQPLGTTAVNMAIQAINPASTSAPAAHGDSSQANRSTGVTDAGQNTNANYYPLGTSDISTGNTMNNQGGYVIPTNTMIPDTGQYSVAAQQPLYVVDPSQAAPAPYTEQAPGQATADGTYYDSGEGDDDPVDDVYDDDADDM